MKQKMKTIIIGLGNPILGDDAAGCRVAEAVEEQIKAMNCQDVEVEQFYRGGIALMERLIGYDQALIIDTVQGMGGPIGKIRSLTMDDLPTQTVDSPHDSTLKSALELGRQLGEKLPDKIDIIAVEIKSEFEFSEQLTPPVAEALPLLVNMALEWVNRQPR